MRRMFAERGLTRPAGRGFRGILNAPPSLPETGVACPDARRRPPDDRWSSNTIDTKERDVVESTQPFARRVDWAA